MNFKEFTSKIEDDFQKNTHDAPKKWIISKKLADKITPEGSVRDFYGYTSVIRLPDADRRKCLAIRDELFENNSDLLVRLSDDTYHITVHAYCNVYSVSKNNAEIDCEMGHRINAIKSFFSEMDTKYGNKNIFLKALGPSTNGSDVVSIKFVPETEKDYLIVNELFERSEQIWPLGQPFTPHVSIGYFKLREYNTQDIDRLYTNIQRISKKTDVHVCLPIKELVFQIHHSMNDFRDLFKVRDCHC